MNPLSIYIHWPFCLSKCPYCDFRSRKLPLDLSFDLWQKAYLQELTYYAALLPDRTITTIYFGGGTPSLMPTSLVAAILEKIAALWPLASSCEITLEANPTSSSRPQFQAFRKAGINRLSLGVQALDDTSLRFLGRAHTAQEALDSLEKAQEIFDRVSIDLIYARAGQSPQAWEAELSRALRLGLTHLSLYQLTIEEGTPFFKRARTETLTVPEDDAAILFELTQELTAAAGLPAYEISNHAVPGQESRHNLAYWTYAEYIGIGPAAHGRFIVDNRRTATENDPVPQGWIEKITEKNQGTISSFALDRIAAQEEALLMGLRLTKGLDLSAWQAKFGAAFSDFIPQEKIAPLIQTGYLEQTPTTLTATPQGRQCLNTLLSRLL